MDYNKNYYFAIYTKDEELIMSKDFQGGGKLFDNKLDARKLVENNTYFDQDGPDPSTYKNNITIYKVNPKLLNKKYIIENEEISLVYINTIPPKAITAKQRVVIS